MAGDVTDEICIERTLKTCEMSNIRFAHFRYNWIKIGMNNRKYKSHFMEYENLKRTMIYNGFRPE